MPSSTSSFDPDYPNTPWIRILAVALVVFTGFVLFTEMRLAQLGYRPTVHDSKERWISERARASELGKRALILIGASRIQLGVDLEILRQRTGLEPVQLAIDGNVSTPVLAGLADDPSITGTIIVDYYDHAVGASGGAGEIYQREYEKYRNSGTDMPPNVQIEKRLTRALHEYLKSYSGGASPLHSWLIRIFEGKPERRLLTMLPDRSVLADYSVVDRQSNYYGRVARSLGLKLDTSNSNAEIVLRKTVASLKPADNQDFINGVRNLKRMVSAIEARGGRVLFVAMPSSGMVREIEERRYPRELFWDKFVREVGAPALHSMYVPTLQGFTCPDGSHLDFRDRERFTFALIAELGLVSKQDSHVGGLGAD